MAAETEILLETGTNELEVIEFSLRYSDDRGKERIQPFGINVAKVREIIRMPQITKLPQQHNSVLGIFKLRNELIPVINLTDWLFNYDHVDENQKVIVTEFNNIKVGFIVHDVNRIHRLSWAQVDSPDSVNDLNIENSSVVGIVRFESKIVLMLDVEKILAELNPDLSINAMADRIKHDGGGRRVLLAEDSPTIRNMLTTRLSMAGYEITSMHNGKSAWEKLLEIGKECETVEKLFNRVDLVITDIEMPQMDGYSLTKRIKQHDLLKHLPVVIFSSMITDDARHKGESVGADAQYSKPQIDTILDSLDAMIEKRDAQVSQ